MEWQCPACGHWNGVSLQACTACKAGKPAVGRIRGPQGRPLRVAATGAPLWTWTRVAAFLLVVGSLATFVAGTSSPNQIAIGGSVALGLFVLGVVLASYDAGVVSAQKRTKVRGLRSDVPLEEPRWRRARAYAIVLIALGLLASVWTTFTAPDLVVLRVIALIPLIGGLAWAAYAVGERQAT